MATIVAHIVISQVVSLFHLTLFVFFISTPSPKKTLCYTWDSDLLYSDPESMGRVATPGGDLLNDPLDYLQTYCAGTIRSIAFII